MFIVLKKKTLILISLFCVLMVITTGVCYKVQAVSYVPAPNFRVVLDAGHGGIDGGSQGKSGVYERDINLSVTNKIEKLLKTIGIDVVQTRRTEDGLYGTFASGFKMRDMKARKAIIQQAKPDLVVSVHMNFYTNSSARGAQVFYKPNSEISKEFAGVMQELFVKNLPQARKTPSVGDFYMLTCTSAPGVLVECGYLSNPKEEQLLISNDYQEKVAYQIFCGIVSYFNLK